MHNLITIGLFLACGVMPAFLHGQSTGLQAEGRAITLPQGQMFSASLSPDGTRLAAQQIDKVSTRNDGSEVWARRLVSVSTITDLLIRNRGLGELPNESSGIPCSRMQFLHNGHMIAICSAGKDLELVDAEGLETRRSFPLNDPGTIRNFEIAEGNDLILLLRLGEQGIVWLDRYKLSSGVKIDSTEIERTKSESLHLALDTRAQIAYLAIKPIGKKTDVDMLAVCHYSHAVICKNVENIPPVAHMQVWNGRLLVVNSRFADNHRDCITSFQPATGKFDASYCAPKVGVHYAFSVIQDKFLAAYTGTAKYHAWSERAVPKSTSISLWSSETRDPAGKVAFPMNTGGFQNGTTIVGASEASVFAAYESASNVIEVYALQAAH